TRLLDVGDDLLVDVRVGGDADHRGLLVEQRDRPVLHLAGGVGLGRDVRDLLELERPRQAHRQADVPAEVEEERLGEVPLRYRHSLAMSRSPGMGADSSITYRPTPPAWYAVPQARTTIRRRFRSSTSVRPMSSSSRRPWRTRSPIVSRTDSGCS